MANQGFRRSYKTPQGYSQSPSGRVSTMDGVYLGFVKSTEDTFKNGRLKVWIPDFSPNPDDESQWVTVRYCSPFAGATPVKDNVKEGKNLSDTQQSYGWWSVPPDVDNEVAVMFINGDPNRGIYIGGFYQPFMNHMVPGIPSGDSYTEGAEGVKPPVAEYNRWDPSITHSDNRTRARYDPLHEALKNQGLYTDPQRGPTTAGARRDNKSTVYGFKSPQGHQMVFDDAEDNSFIRFRTKSGAQVFISETGGYVYIISANGNSWFEISDDGINGYSAETISFRSQADMNFHSDANMNFYAKKNMNIFGGNGATLQSKNLHVLSGETLNLSSQGDFNFLTKGNLSFTATGNLSLKADGTLAVNSAGAMGVKAGGNLFLTGAQIQNNAGDGPTATEAKEAAGPKPGDLDDSDVNVKTNYEGISTKSIVSVLPAHEPWSGHPSGKSGPASTPLDTSVSSRTAIDGNSKDPVQATDGDQSDKSVTADNAEFVGPATGPISSPWGPRNVKNGSRFHKGVDLGIPVGTPIVASRAGTVTKAGAASGYGIAVFIKHDNGYTTEYGHLSACTVKVGQEVKAGQQIARSGNTGRSTGPHLHFTIKKNGQAIDPAQKLKNARRGGRLVAGKN